MIWNGQNTEKILVDIYENKIPLVFSFDDETKEAVIYIKSTNGKLICELDDKGLRQMVTTTLVLKNAKLVNKEQSISR